MTYTPEQRQKYLARRFYKMLDREQVTVQEGLVFILSLVQEVAQTYQIPKDQLLKLVEATYGPDVRDTDTPLIDTPSI